MALLDVGHVTQNSTVRLWVAEQHYLRSVIVTQATELLHTAHTLPVVDSWNKSKGFGFTEVGIAHLRLG